MTTKQTRQDGGTTRDAEPEVLITSRLTTDGTKYLPETYETTDGTVALPWPMIDPQTGVRGRLPDQWPIGDPRREDRHDDAGRRDRGPSAPRGATPPPPVGYVGA